MNIFTEEAAHNRLGTIKRRVAYFYDNDIGDIYYGPTHPMKPFRLTLAHSLILEYGLCEKMEVYRPHLATSAEMKKFHLPEYIEYLEKISPNVVDHFIPGDTKYNIGENDCPAFTGMYEFSCISAGGSIDAAMKLNNRSSDICINWAGGLHHAKKGEASGFCYVNDIVLGILELLKRHRRVLYIDIDVHHGDGVEQAFYVTNRVMTVSFHRFGNGFFPATGGLSDVGSGPGRFYSMNVPLRAGLDDFSFIELYKEIIREVISKFCPQVIVLQCGADSLALDRLGPFNLSIKAHAEAVRFTRDFGLPLMVLGGGGYTIKNVARCWAYETGVLLDKEVGPDIPEGDYHEYFSPTFNLFFDVKEPQKMNENSKQYLGLIRQKCLNNLKDLENAPSVPFHHVPEDFYHLETVQHSEPQ